MPNITLEDVSRIIFREGRLFIPRYIEKAIVQSSGNDVDKINEAGEALMDAYREQDAPINVDYSDSITADAYGLFYTRRNFIIPRIAFRDIVLNSNLQLFPSHLKILDLGSGTGAVVIGLLDMLQHSPLDSISVEIDAIDIAQKPLDKLIQILEITGLMQPSVTPIVLDVTDTDELRRILSRSTKYDLIFAANLFGELGVAEALDVLECAASFLSEIGMMFIVNAPKNQFIKMIPKLVGKADELSLAVYYPCPPNKAHSCSGAGSGASMNVSEVN